MSFWISSMTLPPMTGYGCRLSEEIAKATNSVARRSAVPDRSSDRTIFFEHHTNTSEECLARASRNGMCQSLDRSHVHASSRRRRGAFGRNLAAVELAADGVL